MTPQTVKRFKILNIEGPTNRGRLHQFHDYLIEIELDSGEPYITQRAKAAVSLDDIRFFSLTQGGLEDGKARIAYYVIEKLKSILMLPGAHIEQVFEPTREEVSELQRIDPARVSISDWVTIPEVDTDPPKKGSPEVNITANNGDVIISGDVVGRYKTTVNQ